MASIFKNPWMLMALLAVSIPLIIEWLFRRRKRQVELPTLRFLLNNKEQEKIRRQDRILLILRSVGIFLLVMAIARPVIQRGWLGSNQKRNVVILIDATASMNQQVDVESAFRKAISKASGLVRKLPEDGTATVTVGVIGLDAHEVVAPTKDLQHAANAVAELRPTFGAAPVNDGLDWVRRQIDQAKFDKAELYVFSDFQKQTWLPKDKVDRVSQGLGDLRGRCETFLVDVGGEPAFNFLVTDLMPGSSVITARMPVTFTAALDAVGKVPPGKKALATLSIDGARISTQEVELTGPTTVQFSRIFPTAGEYLVEVAITGDDFNADNSRLYLINVPDTYRVLVLDDLAAGDAENRLKADSRFLAAAVAPKMRPGFDPVSHFSVNVVPPSQILYENVDNYAVIVLTGTQNVSEPIIRKIERRVRDGAGMLVFGGPDVNVYDYNRLMFNEQSRQSLLPCRLTTDIRGGASGLVPPESQPDQPVPQYKLSSHPVMSHLANMGVNKDGSIFQSMAVGPLLGGAQTILSLSDKSPLLIEKPLGEGRVILCTTTAGPKWNFLPAVPEYGVLFQELLSYLVGDPDRSVNLNVNDAFVQPVYVSSQKITFQCPDQTTIEVEPYAIRNVATSQPTASTRPEDDASVVEYRVRFEQTTLPGEYQVVERIQEVVPRRRFVVNQGSSEADLARLSEKEFKQSFRASDMTWVDRDQVVADMAASLHSFIELAWAILTGLAILLAGESYLAWRFGRRRGD